MMMVDRFSRLCGTLAGVAVTLATLHVVVDVVMRWLGSPLEGTIEITSYIWMPLIIFLALPGAYAAREHLQATLLIDALRGRWRIATEAVVKLAFLLVSAALAYYLWIKGLDSFQIRETNLSAGLSVPIWPTRLAAAFGFSLMAVQIAVDLARTFRSTTDHAEAMEMELL